MTPSLILALRKDVTITESGPDLIVSDSVSKTVFRQLNPAIRSAIGRLAHPGTPEASLTESIRDADSGDSLAIARWFYHLQRLARQRWLLMSLDVGENRLVTLMPISSEFVFALPRTNLERRFILSRFAYLRTVDGDLVLESPLAFSRLVLHDRRAVELIHALAQGANVRDLSDRIVGLDGDTVAELLALFSIAGMVVEVSENGVTAEDEKPALRCWEFHDLLFHARSRVGRHDAPAGGIYRFAGKLDAPPPLKPTLAKAIDLPRPDLERLKHDDPTLTEVMETRSSKREYSDAPITIEQLGEFLFRVARVKERREWEVPTAAGSIHMEGTARPFPAGGGLYEMELYTAVNSCRGLESGLYHYDPLGHRLESIGGRTREVEALLIDAAQAAGVASESLQLALIVASRFPRLAWKYQSLAYALTLKHVGVLYQTMYLVATAMGLAPCGLGGGNSDLFAQATGINYFEETSVGEFLLGSKR